MNLFDSIDNNTIFGNVSNNLINNIKCMSCIPSNPKLDKLLPLTNNDVRKSTEYLATIEDNRFRDIKKRLVEILMMRILILILLML